MWKVIFLVFLCASVKPLPFDDSEDSQKIGASCEDYDECDSIPNGICNVDREECECKEDYIPSADKTSCLELAEELGDECEITEQCKNLPSAICVENVCKIMRGEPDVAMKIVPSETKSGNSCTEDSQCSLGTCQSGICSAATGITLGKTCLWETDCPMEGHTCVNEICRCKDDFIVSQNLKSCLLKATSIGSSCNETIQCIHLNNSICENGKCTELKMLRVLPNSLELQPPLKLGSSCIKVEDCDHIAKATCKENVCQCIENHVTSLASKSCLPKAKEEGDQCEINEQCLDIKAICSKNKCVTAAAVGRSMDNNTSGASTTAFTSTILGSVAILFYFSSNYF